MSICVASVANLGSLANTGSAALPLLHLFINATWTDGVSNAGYTQNYVDVPMGSSRDQIIAAIQVYAAALAAGGSVYINPQDVTILGV